MMGGARHAVLRECCSGSMRPAPPPRDGPRTPSRPGTSVGASVARALADFGTLVLPTSCVRCGAWDTSLCVPCLRLFRRSTVRPFRAESGAESLPDVHRPEG